MFSTHSWALYYQLWRNGCWKSSVTIEWNAATGMWCHNLIKQALMQEIWSSQLRSRNICTLAFEFVPWFHERRTNDLWWISCRMRDITIAIAAHEAGVNNEWCRAMWLVRQYDIEDQWDNPRLSVRSIQALSRSINNYQKKFDWQPTELQPSN